MAFDSYFRIYDKNLNLVREVSSFQGLMFTEKSDTYGEFEIVTGESDDYTGYYIRCMQNPELAGKIEYYASEDDTYTMKGYSLLGLLYDRWTVPTTQDAPDGYYHYTNRYAEDVIYDIVNRCAVNPRNSARRIPNLTCATSQSRGGRITLDTRYERVTDVIESICLQTGLSARIRLDASSKKLVFEVYKGTDRTQDNSNRYLIATKFDRVESERYEASELLCANYAYVLGEGEGKDRTCVIVDKRSSSSDPIRELVVDARDVANTVEDDPDYDVTASLTARGEEKLAELQPTATLDVTVSPDEYGTAYNLGDTVKFVSASGDLVQKGKITEATHTWEDGVHQVAVTVGQATTTVFGRLRNELSMKTT